MALPKNITLSQKEVSQEIDLEEVTGVNLSGNPSLKTAIGQALIDFMVDRTKSGKDINRSPFLAYKKSYKESEQFEAYAKDNKVDMELSGNMLSDIDLNNSTGSKIKIFMGSEVNNAKAYNHMKGETVRPRQWFGLRDKDVEEVLSDFSEELGELRDEPESGLGRFIQNIQLGGNGPEINVEGDSLIINIRDLFGES